MIKNIENSIPLPLKKTLLHVHNTARVWAINKLPFCARKEPWKAKKKGIVYLLRLRKNIDLLSTAFTEKTLAHPLDILNLPGEFARSVTQMLQASWLNPAQKLSFFPGACNFDSFFFFFLSCGHRHITPERAALCAAVICR